MFNRQPAHGNHDSPRHRRSVEQHCECLNTSPFIDGGRHRGQRDPRNDTPGCHRRMVLKTTPIYLDRLDSALKKAGVYIKRCPLLETTAAAFGFHNSNEFTAAAARGDLAPTTSEVPTSELQSPKRTSNVVGWV